VPRSAEVKAEGELVEVVVELLVADRALGLGADPLALTGELQPFGYWELEVLVIVGRLPLVVDSLCRLESRARDHCQS